MEVYRRGLYLSKGFGSLYEYCKGELGYTDASAWRRVRAALAIARCPEAFTLLELRRINMCTLGRIYKFVTPALLGEICDKSQAEVELIAATYDAKGVAPDRTRPVIVPKTKKATRDKAQPSSGGSHIDRPISAGLRSEVKKSSQSPLRSEVTGEDERLEFEQKWKIEAVVTERVKRMLQRCKSLLSNKYPKGIDYDVLLDELTEVFLDRKDPERKVADRKKRVKKLVPKNAPKDDGRAVGREDRQSRYIPQTVRETVWARDKGKCAFVGTDGRRCNSTYTLQFDHFPVQYARGGPSTANNLRLLCARHNRLTAEEVFGKQHVQAFIPRRE